MSMPTSESPFIAGIICPVCDSTRLRVTNSRQVGHTVRRSRRCMTCGELFQTREIREDDLADIDGLDDLMTDSSGSIRRYPGHR